MQVLSLLAEQMLLLKDSASWSLFQIYKEPSPEVLHPAHHVKAQNRIITIPAHK